MQRWRFHAGAPLVFFVPLVAFVCRAGGARARTYDAGR
jgi:hypothetical protein